MGAGCLLFLCGVIRQNLVQGLVLSLKALVSVLAVPDVEEPQVVSPLAYGWLKLLDHLAIPAGWRWISLGRDYLQQHWCPFPLRLLLFGPQRVEDGHGKDYPSSHVKPCLGWVRIWVLTEGWVAAALMVFGPSQILVDQAVHLDSIMCFLFLCMYIYIGLESCLSMGRKTSTQQMPTTKSKHPLHFRIPGSRVLDMWRGSLIRSHTRKWQRDHQTYFSVGGAIRDNFTVNEHMNNHVSHGFDARFVYYIFHAFADIEVSPLLLSLPAWGCIPVNIPHLTSFHRIIVSPAAGLPAGMRI